MYIKQDMDFNDLMNNCWSGAIDTLKTIEENDKEDELMEFLMDEFTSIPELTEINDLLRFEDEFIFKCLGISETEDKEEKEIECKNQKCEDCYKYILGVCEGI